VADAIAGSVLDLRSALAQLRAAGAARGAGTEAGPGPAPMRGSWPRCGSCWAWPTGRRSPRLRCRCAARKAPRHDGAGSGPVHEFLLSRCLSIAGGTTQILLSVVAERVLGLPREEMR